MSHVLVKDFVKFTKVALDQYKTSRKCVLTQKNVSMKGSTKSEDIFFLKPTIQSHCLFFSFGGFIFSIMLCARKEIVTQNGRVFA